MNERIRELLGQAYDEAVPETWTTLSSEQLGRIYEKFAELIVRECAEYAEHELDMAGYKKKFMLKHFGVEE
jgi:S-ribosylhomocysteine lyase LuxS involved in autoinducer biosynthesis